MQTRPSPALPCPVMKLAPCRARDSTWYLPQKSNVAEQPPLNRHSLTNRLHPNPLTALMLGVLV
eukprot:scaffold121799_cov12-Tisochrysis_lutea.AAC.1